MTEQRMCDCGRPIFGTRSISARHFEKCSVCRGPRSRRPRLDWQSPTPETWTPELAGVKLPPYVITPDAERWVIMDTRTGAPATENGAELEDRYASAEAAQSVADSLNDQAHLEPLRKEYEDAQRDVRILQEMLHNYEREVEAKFETLRRNIAEAATRAGQAGDRLHAAENPVS